MYDLVGNPKNRFSCDEAYMISNIFLSRLEEVAKVHQQLTTAHTELTIK